MSVNNTVIAGPGWQQSPAWSLRVTCRAHQQRRLFIKRRSCRSQAIKWYDAELVIIAGDF